MVQGGASHAGGWMSPGRRIEAEKLAVGLELDKEGTKE
jgi:hypothetical protein